MAAMGDGRRAGMPAEQRSWLDQLLTLAGEKFDDLIGDAEEDYEEKLAECQTELDDAAAALQWAKFRRDCDEDLRLAFEEAEADRLEAVKERRWAAALEALEDAAEAAGALLEAFDQYAAYVDAAKAFADTGFERQAAAAADRLPAKRAGERTAFDAARKQRDDAVAATRWPAAKAAIGVVRNEAMKLIRIDMVDHADAEEVDVWQVWAVLRNFDEARAISDKPPPGLDPAALAAFRKAHQRADGARKSDVDKFIDRVLELQDAIDALLDAHRAYAAAKAAFDADRAKLAAIEKDAQTVFGSDEPGLAGPLKALKAAQALVDQQRTLGDWAAARNALPALEEACVELVVARENLTVDVDPARRLAAKQQIARLRERAAAIPYGAPFVTEQKELILSMLDKCAAECDKNILGAERDIAAWPEEIKDLEALWARYREVRQLLNETKAIAKQALGVPLTGALKKARDASLAIPTNTLKITKAADKGQLDKAVRLIEAWADEAGAWLDTKDKPLDLDTGDAAARAAQMKDLAALPGGGKVLDAYIAALDAAAAPQAVLIDALGARFGMQVKQFERRKAKGSFDTTGAKAVGPGLPDPSLKSLYEALSRLPPANVKGKVDELIRYVEDDAGAAYLDKKIAMYCGRAEKGAKKSLGDPAELVEPGQEIDENCRPRDAEPVPNFSFSALHEVGHAVDDAKKYMDSAPFMAHAGWRNHTVGEVAAVVADALDYDAAYVAAALTGRARVAAQPPKGTKAAAWEEARKLVEDWCALARFTAEPWDDPSAAGSLAVDGRVYHEAYEGEWVSYKLAARAQGISSYQFRSPAEWFAELYAAYFSKKLKKSHPAMKWLKALKTID